MADIFRGMPTPILMGGLFAVAVVTGAVIWRSTSTRMSATPVLMSSQPPTLSEEEETVGVVRILWPLVRKANDADWRWAQCADQYAVGFDLVYECAARSLRNASGPMPALRFTSTCARHVDQSHRAYVDGRVRFLTDNLAWLNKHRARLELPMKARTLSDVWTPERFPDRPIGVDPKYTEGLTLITKIDCLRKALGCSSAECTTGAMNRIAGVVD